MSTEKLTGQQIQDAGLTGWTYFVGALRTRIATNDFATGLRVVDAIGAAAEELNHHPDLDLRYPRVDVRLSSHDAGGVTERDIGLARRISEIAAAAGCETGYASIALVELGLDTPDPAAIGPFWAAVMGMDLDGDDVVDPYGALPLIWFQHSGGEEPRQRWHPDVWVPLDQVQGRIDAALAAGGTLVSDDRAPMFWVLADSQGNRICLCTSQDRG
jgi:4a-hydroxytetrahydrobiopterin dehydratase